jgi:type I restriction enzyme S subunit
METKELINTKTAWLGEVPSHWEIKRLGGLFEERNEIVSENDYAPLSVTMKGIVPQLESAAKTMHVDNRKKVCVGDFAINSRSDRRGSGGLSYYEGSVSIVNTVLKPSKFYVPEFTHYLLTNKLFQDEYYAKGKGIVADMWSTRFSEMKTIYLPVPPKNEQDEIVQYIKAQEEKINLFIQKKQRFIELLKEQHLSILNNYVTSENKNWIWLRLKDIVTVNDEALTEKTEDNFLIRYIDIGNVNSYGDIAEIQEYEFKDAPSRARRILRKGDVIISTVRTYLKAITLIESDEDNLIASTGFAVLRPKENVLSEYLNFALRAEYFISSVIQNSYGVSYPAINSSTLSSLKIVIPKSTSEQQEIINKIKTETATIDTAIAKAEREIELIREYKEAMIAEAVMGKRK